MVGDWNIFLIPYMDQKKNKNQEKYRTKTWEIMKSKMRTHTLSDIFR